jgi:cysteinyl-tRNA synthetase
MSTNRLGPHFDIHGGGADLTFPHHENEIAQSEAATGQPFVNVWMHNGHVRVDDEKMSKSLGNFFTVREMLKKYSGEVIRYFLVASHYRSPLNYSDQQLDAARESLTRLYTALRGLPATSSEASSGYPERFQAAMDDDFNTPEALAVLFDLARESNRLRNEAPAQAADYAATLRKLAETLGLLQDDPAAYLQAVANEEVATSINREEIERLIFERESARKRKDWAEADRLRDELDHCGIRLEDGADGTTWRRNH